VDTGVSLHSLMKVSHIHLFGIGLVALAIGLVFRFALLPAWFHHTLTLVPFIAIFTDILAWFVTKWDPHYAYGRCFFRRGLGSPDQYFFIPDLVFKVPRNTGE